MLCAVHLQYAQLFLWFPNTAGATRISHVTPKVGANFTVKFKLNIRVFFLAL